MRPYLTAVNLSRVSSTALDRFPWTVSASRNRSCRRGAAKETRAALFTAPWRLITLSASVAFRLPLLHRVLCGGVGRRTKRSFCFPARRGYAKPAEMRRFTCGVLCNSMQPTGRRTRNRLVCGSVRSVEINFNRPRRRHRIPLDTTEMFRKEVYLESVELNRLKVMSLA